MGLGSLFGSNEVGTWAAFERYEVVILTIWTGVSDAWVGDVVQIGVKHVQALLICADYFLISIILSSSHVKGFIENGLTLAWFDLVFSRHAIVSEIGHCVLEAYVRAWVVVG